MIDCNEGVEPEESSFHSPTYAKMLALNRQERKTVTYEPVKPEPKQSSVGGLECYSSKHMDYNNQGVCGTVYKRIANVKFYHKSNFHMR